MNEQMGSSKNREFICACGKNYLSYAALFTHIKQKHEGKAPGPITRPRSQRKRGRPRKNPNAQNQMSESESDQPQNGILKGLDINNIQKEQQQQLKNKKSIQLLGSGAFAAFTAYKPEPARCLQKKQGQSSKKIMSKKMSCQNIQRKHSASFNVLQQKQYEGDIKFIVNSQKQRQQMLNFCQNLEVLNKLELKKVFERLNKIEGKIELRNRDLQILNKLNSNIESNHGLIDYESASAIVGMAELLKQTRQLLIGDQQTKIEHSSYTDQGSQQYSNEFDQVLFMVTFMLDELMEHHHRRIQDLQNINLNKITQNLNNFVFYYLPPKIKMYNLHEHQLFKNFNPVKFMIYISNWITFKKTVCELSKHKSEPLGNDIINQTPDKNQYKHEHKQQWSESHHSSQILHRDGDPGYPSISKIDGE